MRNRKETRFDFQVNLNHLTWAEPNVEPEPELEPEPAPSRPLTPVPDPIPLAAPSRPPTPVPANDRDTEPSVKAYVPSTRKQGVYQPQPQPHRQPQRQPHPQPQPRDRPRDRPRGQPDVKVEQAPAGGGLSLRFVGAIALSFVAGIFLSGGVGSSPCAQTQGCSYMKQ